MTLFVGFLVGLALIAPVGPVAITLFGLGAEQGRRAALYGAAGVVGADGILLPLALAGAGSVGDLDPLLVRSLEMTVAGVLVFAAGAALSRSAQTRNAIAAIRRPTRTLFVLSVLNPLGLAAWLGLALALPVGVSGSTTLVVFGIGILIASVFWHAGLAVAGDTVAARLGDRGRQHLTRLSGLVMIAIAVTLCWP